MHPKRPGPLYSPLGCGTAVLLVIVLGVILYFSGGGPFSPGPLSAADSDGIMLSGFSSHADFEGDCGQCHAPWRGISADRCENCHTSVADERVSNTGLHGALNDVGRCQKCHTDHQGRDAGIILLDLTSFEHDKITDFSLDRHQRDFDDSSITCQDCHLNGRFVVASVDCIQCHSSGEPLFTTDHIEFFGDSCLACHDGRDTMANFDHQEVFALVGAHDQLECAACHRQQIFAGTPRECIDCHEEPPVHFGLFGTDCARCHTTDAWRPAQLTQHTFPLDHGGEGKIECQTCHAVTYAEYTCYNCHAHDPADIREEHVDEGIFEFDDCVDCHPTGLEDESVEFEGAKEDND